MVPTHQAKTIRLGSQPVQPRLRRGGRTDVSIGYIGAITRHKGVETLLEAFRLAPPHWRLTIAGDGDLSGIVRAAAANDARITMLGEIEGDAKDAFFDALDVVVIPSFYEEPATFVVVEAAARGIPAVVSNRGGLPEAPEVRTFPAGDAKKLLSAIHWFVDEPTRLAAASERLVGMHGQFLWERHMMEVRAVLVAAARSRQQPSSETS